MPTSSSQRGENHTSSAGLGRRPRPESGEVTFPSDIDTIILNGKDLWDIAEELNAILKRRNNPPTLFQANGTLVLLVKDPITKDIRQLPLNQFALRHHIARICRWATQFRGTSGQLQFRKRYPPIGAVQDFLYATSWDEAAIPVLARLTETPTFAADCRLIDKPGYDLLSRTYYAPAPGLVIPPVSLAPTPDEVTRAISLLFDELFLDFPFKEDNGASKAHTLAAALEHFVRQMIDGPTPLNAVTGSSPGTGKGLLVDCITIITTGRQAETSPALSDDDEIRKAITASLISNPPYVFLDNLEGRVDSPALANCLTSPLWTDRILGESRKAHLPVLCTWIAAGNNFELTAELARRSLRIRLEPLIERPWERRSTDFKHSLPTWACFAPVESGRFLRAS